MEDKSGAEFKEKLVELMTLQQKANKNNLTLQICNLIISMLIFIMLIVIVSLR